MILLLDLVLIACDSRQAYPHTVNKPIKGAKAEVGNRKRKLIRCCHIGRGAKRSRKPPSLSAGVKVRLKLKHSAKDNTHLCSPGQDVVPYFTDQLFMGFSNVV